MRYAEPHLELETEEREIEVVGAALNALHAAGILPGTAYDAARFLAHRQAVRDCFEIPWTAISPRMQRLLYAVNAIARPRVMLAAGVFCGNTFISNAGAAVGPGACYEAADLAGIEIKPDEAERAERNVRRLDETGKARVVAAEAVAFVSGYPGAIDLLYLDADGTNGRGKGVYLDILEACLDRLSPGALVLAHNSVNAAERLGEYLAFVRDPEHFANSLNVVIDPEGLEVSVR
jgi:predicted O-methyltransferase YrrM